MKTYPRALAYANDIVLIFVRSRLNTTVDSVRGKEDTVKYVT